ncbi:MAG: SGNH/GDSL hydrolase family protein [Chloroflexota bacterium]
MLRIFTLLSILTLLTSVAAQDEPVTIPNPTPPSFPGPTQDYMREIYTLGQSLGRQADVFIKVGDSATASPTFLTPIGDAAYDLAGYTDLQGVVDFYSATPLRNGNSFNNQSLASGVGWTAAGPTNPDYRDRAACERSESPLQCAVRVNNPSVALVMLGTNEVSYMSVDDYLTNMGRLIDEAVELGVIPVISTIPPRRGNDEKVAAYNEALRTFTTERRVPLWDYAAVLATAPDDGMMADRIHPSSPPGNAFRGSATFTPDNLIYGFTLRNLTALQTLAAVRAVVG